MAIVKHIKSRNANYSAAINYLLFSYIDKMIDCQLCKLEIIYVFANIPYLLAVHRPHKLDGHNYR